MSVFSPVYRLLSFRDEVYRLMKDIALQRTYIQRQMTNDKLYETGGLYRKNKRCLFHLRPT